MRGSDIDIDIASVDIYSGADSIMGFRFTVPLFR